MEVIYEIWEARNFVVFQHKPSNANAIAPKAAMYRVSCNVSDAIKSLLILQVFVWVGLE